MKMNVRLAVWATLVALLLVGARPLGIRGLGQQPGERAVTLRIIVLTSPEAAGRILERLNAGESFAVLARTESVAPDAVSGGWLGRLPLGQLRPEVRAQVAPLSPGQHTPVIRIPTGYAIFKVEEDDPAEAPAARVSPALASTGAIRYVHDLSGFTEARTAVDTIEKPADWNMDPRAICDVRTRALASTRANIEAYLAPENRAALAARPAIDVMQLQVALGQLHAYAGRMDAAVARFQEAAATAASGVPAAVLQMEEALGIVHFHKATLDNDVPAAPGEFCLLSARPGAPYPKPADSRKAIEHFRQYLETRPEDLEVRWLLNLAYMTVGGYPDQVPAAHLIPPSVFTSTEDVGRFRDVAPAAGLTHFASAGGAVVEDLFGRDRFDVVASTQDSCGALALLANNGDGTFTNRSSAAGIGDQLGGLNLVPGDYNNDGCVDLLVLRGGWESLPQRKSLLRNNCDGTFTDVTFDSGLAAPATTTQTAVWTDIDLDGDLDLFVGNESGPAQLFRNRGNGTFEDIGPRAGVARAAFTKGVTAADYDNDRYPDLYVSNYGERNFLYRNNGNGTFTELAEAARVLGTPTGFATWFFDYDNDGHSDLFVTSYVSSIDEMVRGLLGRPQNATTMKLYRNAGDGSFRDVSGAMGLGIVRMPMGANFGDIDNDGFLDMYLGGGQPSYAALAGSVLLKNREGRQFADVTASSGTGELHKGHGVAFADLDHDGDQDIVFEVGGVSPGDRHAMRLFENPGHGNDWLAVKLVGVKSNRTAVGARLTAIVTGADGRKRAVHRSVTTGGSFGASPLMQHIGLGRRAKTVDLEIWWPATDSRQRFTDVRPNQFVHIEEFARTYSELKRDRVRLGGVGARP